MKNYSQQEFLKTVTQKKPPNPTCNVVITNQTFDKIIGNCTHLFLRTFGKNWKLSFSIKQNLFAKYLVTSTQMKPTSNFNKANELYKSLPSFCLKMKHKKKIVFWGFPIIFLRRKKRQKKIFEGRRSFYYVNSVGSFQHFIRSNWLELVIKKSFFLFIFSHNRIDWLIKVHENVLIFALKPQQS